MRVAGEKSEGELYEVLNAGAGGFLILSKVPFSLGTELEIRFTIQGYNAEVQGKGRVARVETGVMGIEFVGEPAGMNDLLAWLEAGLISSYL